MKKKHDKRAMKRKHYFFLNPYDDCAFTKCPKCDGKTKIRKFPLVMHIDPNQIILLNKNCRYCTTCDLVVARQSEIESLMIDCLEEMNPEVIGNDYLTLGVVDRKDWKEGCNRELDSAETLDRAYFFKDMLTFELIPAGWYRQEKDK
ncbi:MAG: hypothetical protein DRP56_00495 [Planctomycetota bacterium]|nr:MAG: hypothetical protein DRP56_00495 [Planctomycetota bacterium]